MSVIDNYLHFVSRSLDINISGLGGIEKALNRIADELEKSNENKGKHYKEDELSLESDT